MSKELHDLKLLVRLQEVYDAVARCIAERNSPPAEIRELQEAARLHAEELEEMERQLAEHQEEVQEVRRKQSEWELELQHFQKQKGMVTNEREFTAVISEIDYATKAIEETTSRRRDLEAAIEQLAQEIADRRSTRREQQSEHKEIVASWEGRKDELLKEVHQLAAQAKEIEAEIQPKHRARFLRLLESKQGKAVSLVVEGSCSLCHFALRPHLQQRVRRCEEIIECEHCHRILFTEESLSRSDSETAEG